MQHNSQKSYEKAIFSIPGIIDTLAEGMDLNKDMAADFFASLMDGKLGAAQAGAVLMGLRVKGESATELAEAARAILARANIPPQLPGTYMDIVGTGGDGRSSFNCSTATALTMAALGYQIVKHGNRSVSSRCGSADVLEMLGFNISEKAENLPQILRQRGFVFLFAPDYHPSFCHVMPIRKEMGIRTLFNILGPLVNPARPQRSLLGVAKLQMLELMAQTQRLLGTEFTAVIHGAGGYDEMTTMGPNQMILIEGHKMAKTIINPADYAFQACDPNDLVITGPDHGTKIMRDLLLGRGPQAMRDMLALNVAAAIYVMRGAESFDACVKQARQAVNGGAGQSILKYTVNA